MAALASKCSSVSGGVSRRSVAARASLTSFQRVGLAASTVACTVGMAVAPALAASRLVNLDVQGSQSPVHVEMTVQGMTVKPASEGLQAKTGHFHVLVDTDMVPEGDMIPFNANNNHYGKGQTSVDLELAPGKHRLTLQFANALHESYGPKYATTVAVDVK